MTRRRRLNELEPGAVFWWQGWRCVKLAWIRQHPQSIGYMHGVRYDENGFEGSIAGFVYVQEVTL